MVPHAIQIYGFSVASGPPILRTTALILNRSQDWRPTRCEEVFGQELAISLAPSSQEGFAPPSVRYFFRGTWVNGKRHSRLSSLNLNSEMGGDYVTPGPENSPPVSILRKMGLLISKKID